MDAIDLENKMKRRESRVRVTDTEVSWAKVLELAAEYKYSATRGTLKEEAAPGQRLTPHALSYEPLGSRK